VSRIWFSLLRLLVLPLSRLIPVPALIRRPRAEIPSLHHEALGLIHVALILDLLDAHTDALLGEDDVLGLELVVRGLSNVEEGEVEVVAYKGGPAYEYEEDHQGEELGES